MASVKFYSVKALSTYQALTPETNALYFVQDVQHLYHGEKLMGVGLAASNAAIGLMSPEDKIKLDALLGISALSPVDGSIILTDIEGGREISVAVSAEAGNILTKKADGLYVDASGAIDIPSYVIERQGAAEDGYAASYKLKKTVGEEVSYVGDVINIPKDLVLNSASLEIATEADVPYTGAVAGEPYIHMAFNDASASDIYVPVKELVDTYTAGDGILIKDNVISINIAENSHGLIAVDGAMSIKLATRGNDGAMSKEDKLAVDSLPYVYVAREYEVSSKPDGTLVDYRDKELRIMCPADTQWTLQNSGEGADANSYYIGVKAYAPADAVSFKEDLAEEISDDTMYLFEGNDFAGTDEFGRKYSIVWLPVARYDGSTWSYYGASSSEKKYIGWFYSVEWYGADGKIISADTIRINLSNEACHDNILPYYMVGYATVEQVEDIQASLAELEDSYTWGEL